MCQEVIGLRGSGRLIGVSEMVATADETSVSSTLVVLVAEISRKVS